jgi:hypothetical protein
VLNWVSSCFDPSFVFPERLPCCYIYFHYSYLYNYCPTVVESQIIARVSSPWKLSTLSWKYSYYGWRSLLLMVLYFNEEPQVSSSNYKLEQFRFCSQFHNPKSDSSSGSGSLTNNTTSVPVLVPVLRIRLSFGSVTSNSDQNWWYTVTGSSSIFTNGNQHF